MKFYNVTSNEYYFGADPFDVKKDATYEIEIKSSQNSSLIVGFVRVWQMEIIRQTFELFYGYIRCSKGLQYLGIRHSVLMKFDQNMTQKHTGIISSAEVLQPIILSCSTLNQSTSTETDNFEFVINEREFRLNFSLAINFTNPVTFSESHQALFLIVPRIILSIYCLIFLSWIINWIRNFTLKNLFHLGLSITFLITFIYMILYTIEYKAIGQSKSTKHLTTATTCFRYFHQIFIIINIYQSMLWSQSVFPPLTGFQKYIFGYVSALYFIPCLAVHMKLRESSEFETAICLMCFKIVELIIFLCGGFSKIPNGKSDLVYYIYGYFYFTLASYCALILVSSPKKYILETASNLMTLVVMGVFFYSFNLTPVNRNNYWILDDDIEIRIAERSEESDDKPPNNWQEETETIRLPWQFNHNAPIQ